MKKRDITAWREEVVEFFGSMGLKADSDVDQAWADLAKTASVGMAIGWVEELVRGAVEEAFHAGYKCGDTHIRKFAPEHRGRAAQAMRDRTLSSILKKYRCEKV